MKGGVRLLGPSGEQKREKETQRDTERERERDLKSTAADINSIAMPYINVIK